MFSVPYKMGQRIPNACEQVHLEYLTQGLTIVASLQALVSCLFCFTNGVLHIHYCIRVFFFLSYLVLINYDLMGDDTVLSLFDI